MYTFDVEKRDLSCKGRIGIFQLGTFKIPTPILWLGHSLKSRLHLSSVFETSSFPLLISVGDLIGRDRLREKIVLTGIHKFLAHQGPILADSGGFKLMSQANASISIESLLQFYESSGVNIGVTLDYPMSLEISKAANKQRWRQTVRNLKKMHQSPTSIPIIPVIHGHSLSQICTACIEVKSVDKEPVLIGIGSLVPMIKSSYIGEKFRYQKNGGGIGNQIAFIADAIEIIKEFFPTSLLHVFGVGGTTSILPLYALGVDSVDSVAWRIKAAYGAILLHGKSNRNIFERPYSKRRRKMLDLKERDLIAVCQCPTCRVTKTCEAKLQLLESSFRARAIHNAWVVLQEISNFRQAMSRGAGKQYLADILCPRHRMYFVLANRL
jgi:7-cyano-7-deazaguanine tRNA-ribosyltransferase